MPSNDKDAPADTPADKLAALVAQRKVAREQRPRQGVPGPRQSERAAGPLSASRSKPAPRK